ncbi:MAG TPA: winged helix-turn-helix domain-containing protein [Pilimelia sp.]|nr:winged helix-turn-helix domain-containing protein [Pilimelia sp.]
MSQPRRTFTITDERALGALAHPLRLRLLGLLRADGPATATRLAERVRESSGVTSYHLRKLAEVGLVAEDRDRGTRRERWWRSVHQATQWSAADFLGNPEAHRLSVSMRREIQRWHWRLLEQWLAEESEWDKAWVDVAGSSDNLLVMTPDSLRDMTAEIAAVVQRYRDAPPSDTADAADAARVVWLQHAIPVRGELPL